MIIWIASYPKSGNTWVRSFLTTLLYSKNGENDFSTLKQIKQFPTRPQFDNLIKDFKDINELAGNWIKAQEIINLDGEIKFLKTHHMNCTINNCNFTNHKNSLGVIHVVRDPRNVLTSIKNHYSFSDINRAIKFLLNNNTWLDLTKQDGRSGGQVPTPLSSWKNHYNSWKNKTNNYLLVKYEDLIQHPNEKFTEIANYVSKLSGLKFDIQKIKNSIDSNSFESLQELEESGKFSESVHNRSDENKIKFFSLGPKNRWQDILDQATIKEIEDNFSSEMRELNYIS